MTGDTNKGMSWVGKTLRTLSHGRSVYSFHWEPGPDAQLNLVVEGKGKRTGKLEHVKEIFHEDLLSRAVSLDQMARSEMTGRLLDMISHFESNEELPIQ